MSALTIFEPNYDLELKLQRVWCYGNVGWISNTDTQLFLAINEMPMSADALGTENLQASLQAMGDTATERGRSQDTGFVKHIWEG